MMPKQQGPLDGRVAVVTGAASAMGAATASGLRQQGAALVMLDRDAEGLAAAAGTISAEPGAVISTRVIDLAEVGTLPGVVDSILAEHGHIDVLVNLAAYRHLPDELLPAVPEVWTRTLAINLTAPAVLIAAVAPAMIAAGRGGWIVNVSSSSAFRAAGSPPVAYASSKAGLSALTRAAAAELGPHGINVNIVAPGPTRSGMAVRAGVAGRLDELSRNGPVSNLMKRASEPEDVASVIAFLCTPASRQITGQIIHTSAGLVV